MLQELEEGESERFKYGVAAMQGWRTEMVCRMNGTVSPLHGASTAACILFAWPKHGCMQLSHAALSCQRHDTFGMIHSA